LDKKWISGNWPYEFPAPALGCLTSMSYKWPGRAKNRSPAYRGRLPSGVLRYIRAGRQAPHRVGESCLTPLPPVRAGPPDPPFAQPDRLHAIPEADKGVGPQTRESAPFRHFRTPSKTHSQHFRLYFRPFFGHSKHLDPSASLQPQKRLLVSNRGPFPV
jgi:hypothetical protein